jgi:alkaline phosphatase
MAFSVTLARLGTVLGLLCLLAPPAWARDGDRPRAAILLIGDGFGIQQLGLLEDYVEIVLRKKARVVELMEKKESILGLLDTSPSFGLVVDSAASATAMACGELTLNGRIAMDAKGSPLSTVLERAAERGWATGLVTSTRITHATPACFAAHVPSRVNEREIARQLVDSPVDLLLGGGFSEFLGEGRTAGESLGAGVYGAETRGAAGEDDLLVRARATKRNVLGTKADLETAPPGDRILGLFAPSHLPYVVDRDELGCDQIPTLAEMTGAALVRLSRRGSFFLMVEGGRIDHAAHMNDAASMVHEEVAFDEAIGTVLDFLASYEGEAVLLVTGDHETGGFSLADSRTERSLQALSWLDRQKCSFELLESLVDRTALKESVARHLGLELTDEEVALFDKVQDRDTEAARIFKDHLGRGPTSVLGHIIARSTPFVWNTGSHTDSLIPVYAIGPGVERLRGLHSNAVVGELLLDFVAQGSGPSPAGEAGR